MNNKVPIAQSFQRLYKNALDDTYIFDTIEEAIDYSANNNLAYTGQLLFVKEYRTADNVYSGQSKSALYYINQNKEPEPVCWFDYDALVLLLEVLQEANYIKDVSYIFDKLKEELVENLPKDHNMVVITDIELKNGYESGFESYGATFVEYERVNNYDHKYTFKVGKAYDVNTNTNASTSILAFKQKDPIYIHIPFIKGSNLDSMFSGCSKLVTCEIPYLYWSEVTSMYGFFSDCSSLKSIDTSKWDISNVTTLKYTFARCYELEELDVSSFDTGKVTVFDYMFLGCQKLQEIDVSNWNTSSATNISHLFEGCSILVDIDADKWVTSNVKYMSGIFKAANKLKTVKTSNWNTSNVMYMTDMFYQCSELEEVVGMENWDCSNVKSLDYMFYECKSIVSLDLSKWNISKVTNMASMFNKCSNLEELNLSGWNISNVPSSKFIYMFNGCSKLRKLNISGWNFPTEVTSSDIKYIFQNCTSLTRENVITDGCSDYTLSLIDGYFV